MKQNSLSDWLAYLETAHPTLMDPGLDRIAQVAKVLKLMPFGPLVITVGGTNGKGSCVAFLDEILRASGYRVGVYTSPHLLRYNERVCIQGLAIDDLSLCSAFAAVEKARLKLANITLTYFEYGTLAALWLFKKTKLDIVILEVGMGGRLDATNIIDADLAIISTIALDHQEWLGHDREAIGFEKSGIMRAEKPVICGDFDPPASIKTQAKLKKAKLYLHGKDYLYKKTGETWAWWGKTRSLANLPLPKIELQNAATVLKAVEILAAKLKIPDFAIYEALLWVSLPGRFQVLACDKKVQTILDVAHNPAAGELLAKQIKRKNWQGNVYAVVGMLADKDIAGTLRNLNGLVTSWHVGSLNVLRGAKAFFIVEQLKGTGAKNIQLYETVTQAYQHACRKAVASDKILVLGSFYTVSEVLTLTLDNK